MFSSTFRALLPALLALQMGARASSTILVAKDDAPPLAWWQETVVYQIYPRSFQDSDSDGVGDLKGIQSRLDYLTDLGVGAVWLSPVYTSPMVDFGYDISNFTDIDPTFGTLEDFRALAAAMRARGIKLIMDFIPNHSSDQHPWFQASIAREEPYTDFYTWKDPVVDEQGVQHPPNNWVSVFGGSMWEWSKARRQYYLHQFAKEQPDLRLENPAVNAAMLNAMEFWMAQGVDGFRMDAVPHMFENQTFPDEPPAPGVEPGTPEDEYAFWDHPHTFNLPEVLVSLREYRQLIDRVSAQDGKPRVMMTEGYVEPLEELMKYYGTPSAPIAHFPFNFQLIGLQTLQASALKQVIDSWMSAMPQGAWANWLVGNHDNSRVADKFGPELVDAVNMVVLLLPGTAVTYYGEELGMRNKGDITYEETKDPAGCNAGPDRYQLFSRDPERTPMHWDAGKNAGFSDGEETWLPVHENHLTLNVEAQLGAEESHLKVYKTLVALRRTPEWKYGGMETRTFGADVFGFTRSNATDGLLVLANLGASRATVDARAFGGVGAEGVVEVRSVGFKGQAAAGANVNMGALILEPGDSLVVRYTREAQGSTGGRLSAFGWSIGVGMAYVLAAAAGVSLYGDQ